MDVKTYLDFLGGEGVLIYAFPYPGEGNSQNFTTGGVLIGAVQSVNFQSAKPVTLMGELGTRYQRAFSGKATKGITMDKLLVEKEFLPMLMAAKTSDQFSDGDNRQIDMMYNGMNTPLFLEFQVYDGNHRSCKAKIRIHNAIIDSYTMSGAYNNFVALTENISLKWTKTTYGSGVV